MYYLVDFCCICFYNQKHLQHLSDSNGDNITYFIKLTSYVPEMCCSEMNDQRLVCKTCCETIDAAYKFRQKCLRSKIMLTNYISQLHQYSNITDAVNVYLTDINKFYGIETGVQNENNMETIIEKTGLFENIDKEFQLKENSEFNFKTNIKSEPNPVKFVVIKVENENQNSEEDFEESNDNPLYNQLNTTTDVSYNDMQLKVSEIKKESENQEHFDDTLEVCNSGNNMRIKLTENFNNSLYSEKCSDNILENPEVKMDDNNFELINTQCKSEDMKTEDHAIPFIVQDEDNTAKDEIFFYKTMEEKQQKTSNKVPKHECDEEKMTYVCEICEKEFAKSRQLAAHMRIHTGEKPHVCFICQMKFSQSRSLNTHLKMHSGERVHVCSICQKTFNRKTHLDYHMRTHTDERPYECDICKNKFTQSSHLRSHMRIHTGFKPHQCVVCHKKFSHSNSLTRHMRIHTGEKPYECGVCEMAFSQLRDQKKHMRVHSYENSQWEQNT